MDSGNNGQNQKIAIIQMKAQRIELLHNTETIINTYLNILHNANSRWDYFANARSLSVIPSAFEEIKKAMLEAKARDTRLRFITEITKENIPYTKEFMESVELRHLDGVKGNFGVSDAEYIAISTADTTADPQGLTLQTYNSSNTYSKFCGRQ